MNECCPWHMYKRIWNQICRRTSHTFPESSDTSRVGMVRLSIADNGLHNEFLGLIPVVVEFVTMVTFVALERSLDLLPETA